MAHVPFDWHFAVDRGPDWLFVKIRPPNRSAAERSQLAEDLWSILSRHFTYRVVLEMEEVDKLPSELIDELVLLQKRIHQHGGLLRLSGLSDSCQKTLDLCQPSDGLPHYESREEAVLAKRPALPR